MRVSGCLLVNSIFFPVLCAIHFLAHADVLTERYDNSRSGANLAETALTTENVDTTRFGKLWAYAVDGSVYAQPLYVAGVNVAGAGTRNVLYVATMNDVVYAFDADSAATVWVRDLRDPAAGIGAVPIVDLTGNYNNLNIVGSVGIESTPVIDRATNTLYLVARTKENGNYVQRLHALDIANGAERANSPVLVEGSVGGIGDGGTKVNFSPRTANQRASLALANGQVYIAWASHEDIAPWHGWVMSYDKTALNRTGILCATPDGADGGIWMGGRAPTVDADGNVYYMVGNGDWNGSSNFGQSFIKIGAPNAGWLPVLDYFTPDNWSALNVPDIDIGSSGPLLIPNTGLIVGGGKESLLYLTTTAALGGLVAGNSQIVQTLAVNPPDPSYPDSYILAGGPAYWNRAAAPWLYVWADADHLKAYRFNGSTFDPTPVSQSTISSQTYGGGVMSVSANADVAGSGIVWISLPTASGGHGLSHGVLHALDAGNLAAQLWNSDQNAADNMGYWPKFSAPTVVNGRVYMGSQSGQVSVYGLRPTNPHFTLSASVPLSPPPVPADAADAGPVAVANPGGAPTYTITVNAGNGFAGSVALGVAGLPPGTTASWSSTSVAAGASATLTLDTSLDTPPGSYPLTVTGISGTETEAAGLVLAVMPARVVSVEFWDIGCTPNGMDVTEIAGVIARPYWNNNQYARQPAPSGPYRTTPVPLIDESGASVNAWLSWSADDERANPAIADHPGDDRLMRCYLAATAGSSASVTISNLPANDAGYDVYVYADGANGSSATTATYQIEGPGIATSSLTITDAANADFSGHYVRADNSAGNYAVFPIRGNGFTLTATAVAASAPINGIQIVPDRIFANGFD